jgi:uncharacterized protein
MRASSDIPRHFPIGSRRLRWVLVIGVIVLIVLIASIQHIASFYTNFLWFQSVGFSSVWAKTITVQAGLAATFSVVLFALLWGNLTLSDRLAPLGTAPAGDELVNRWQELAGAHMKWIRLGAALLFALIGGVSARGQWNDWLLFSNSVPFSSSSAPWNGVDPLNHLNDSFYVFRLPFLSWVVGWAFSALIVTLLLCAVTHYLNGGIRPLSAVQRVSPHVKAHLSVLLAVLALVQGVNYYLQRLSLVLGTNHFFDGASYADVHAMRPALVLLMAISVIAAGLFLYNVRQQGWLLPVVAVVLWALVWALVANVYPALVQSLVVNPSQNTKEAPYIQDNITATNAAYGLQSCTSSASPTSSCVTAQNFQGDGTVTASDVTGNSLQAQTNKQTLANVPLLDPTVMNSTFLKQQGFRGYYTMSGPSTDRYNLPDGPAAKSEKTQVLISARELDPTQVPASWVNTHLQYTHGYGAVLAAANQSGVDPSDGYPSFSLSSLPPQGQPPLSTEPRIYFDTNSLSTSGYVIANSNQAELDYENPSGGEVTTHYDGTGGVPVGGLVRRTAFALSFGDFNILISGQVKSGSKVLYYRNVVQRLENAAPFLSYDGDPYPVVLNGRLYWVEDAYTSTSNFPYSQQANPLGTSRLPGTSELGYENFNYIRNSVKCVVDAYNGTMWFFVQDPNDPMIEVYERAFPKLFTKMSEANSMIQGITSHWRYPEDLFTVQTDMYGRYHQTNAQVFYTNSQQWGIAQNPSSGEVNAATTTVPPLPGALVPVQQAPAESVMPIYELTALPGQTQQSFVLLQPFVPYSNGDKQNLTAFMTAASDPDDYGQLTVFTIPAGQTVDGPYLVSTAVTTNSAISEEITLLSQRGSKVVLGNVIMVAIDQSLLYVQPLYVEGEANGVPRLDDVLVVYNNTAYHSGSGNPSLDAAICQITNPDGSQPFSSYCPGGPKTPPPISTTPPPSKTTTTVPTSPTTTTTTTTKPTSATTLVLPNQNNTIAQDLAEAQQDFSYANAALRQGDLATYQNDIGAGEALVALATKLAETETTTTRPVTTQPAPTTTTTRKTRTTSST